MNYNFKKNNMMDFLTACETYSLIIVGGNSETEQFMNLIAKHTVIEPIGQVNTQNTSTIYPKMEMEDVSKIEDKQKIVVLITDKHPFLWQKKLLDIGINNYYASQMFVERFTFENNTSLCYFYLNE